MQADLGHPPPLTGRALMNRMMTERRRLVPAAAAVLLLGILVALIAPSTYESEAVLMPTSDVSERGRLGSLAASVGLNIGTGAPGTISPELFQSLVTSKYLLGQLAERSYPLRSLSGGAMPLAEVLGGDNIDERIEKLGELISVSYDRIVGLLKLRIATQDPLLSKAILDTATASLEKWTSTLRRHDAMQLRDFVAARIDSVRLDLDQQRSTLERFLTQNRLVSGSSSAHLSRQLQELQLEVTLREAAYTTLVQQLELARMDAARDMPLLRVLDPPRELIEPTGPNRKMIVVLGLVGAVAAMVVGAWLLL